MGKRDDLLARGPMRCSERWPFDDPRDQCALDVWHSGPHKTYHEEGPHTGIEKHIWPNTDGQNQQK